MRIQLDNNDVQRCGYNLQEEGVKLLGVTLDENLDWKLHVKNVTKKISKGNYLLWRYSKQLPISSKKTIYESFVRSHILYGLVAWGGAKQAVLNPLIKTLKKVWNKIGNHRMHTLNRLKKYSILSLKDEIILQESKYLWRWEKKILPRSLFNIITE